MPGGGGATPQGAPLSPPVRGLCRASKPSTGGLAEGQQHRQRLKRTREVLTRKARCYLADKQTVDALRFSPMTESVGRGSGRSSGEGTRADDIGGQYRSREGGEAGSLLDRCNPSPEAAPTESKPQKISAPISN